MHLKFNDNLNLEYKLNGIIMAKSEQEKDLGVLTSGTLLWNDQISACINKANKMIFWILYKFYMIFLVAIFMIKEFMIYFREHF